MLWLDKYERQARLAPGLLAILPIAVAIAALGFRNAPVVSIATSLISMAGGPMLLADTVRSFGVKAQAKLWSSWGGSPTMIALQLRADSPNEVQRDMWRRAVEQVSGIQLASRRGESANPDTADQKIDAAVARLRELTRDEQRFMLVQAENRSYGFRRNFYGIRKLARLIAVAGVLVIGGIGLGRLATGVHPALQPADALGLLANGVIAIMWFSLPSASWVRAAGDKYAYQLLQAAVTLVSDAAGSTATAPNAPSPDTSPVPD